MGGERGCLRQCHHHKETSSPYTTTTLHRYPETPSTSAVMPYYAESDEWNDVEPIPLDEGGPNALAAITYSEEYDEAMSYLRAVMAKNEMSERVLQLTDEIIDHNPAHYTVWCDSISPPQQRAFFG